MSNPSEDVFRVTLLGTGAPLPSIERFGPSTLVEVVREKFIFDAGRRHAAAAPVRDCIQ